MRKDFLVNDQVYHICTKSIAGYKIFNNDEEYVRMIDLIRYYQIKNDLSLSAFMRSRLVGQFGFDNALFTISKDREKLVHIIAYCIMPTHIHLVLKQLKENGVSKYVADILNGYTRYFNTKHCRKGPLWEGRFKNVLVESDEQLLHLTRYQHLNPVTAGLVKEPEDWSFSSYDEYLGKDVISFCDFNSLMDIQPKQYQKFVSSRINDQKDLAIIKKHLFV